ncbi:MAG: transcriptional regulator [Sphingobacteriales bacterium]|nr:MAG: transcriptional regulator [Sphingobacteriales bacterium]
MREEQTTATPTLQHSTSKEENTQRVSDLLDYTASKNAAMTLRAINHKLRQQIVKLLEENKRMNVTDIYVKLRLEQSVASQHLAILRRANIVKTVREGKYIHYALNNDRIAAISKFVKELTSDASDNQARSTENAAA